MRLSTVRGRIHIALIIISYFSNNCIMHAQVVIVFWNLGKNVARDSGFYGMNFGLLSETLIRILFKFPVTHDL